MRTQRVNRLEREYRRWKIRGSVALTGHGKMLTKCWPAAMLLCFLSAGSVLAETQETRFGRLGTCRFWTETTRKLREPLFHLGFAHGFVLGILAGRYEMLLSAGTGEPPKELRPVRAAYESGLGQALQRPAVLTDVWNVQCADYRNEQLDLYDVWFLGILEMGGVASERVEAARQVMRRYAGKYENRWVMMAEVGAALVEK